MHKTVRWTHVRRTCVAAMLSMGGTACGTADAGRVMPTLTWSADTLTVRATLLKDFADSSARKEFIARPYSVRASDDVAFISDVGTDRVAVVDSLANIVRWIGSRGHGPGELFGIGELAVAHDHVLVAEALGGRVSEFTQRGEYVRTFASPFAAGALATTGDVTVSAARSPTHHASLLVLNGAPHDALRIDPRPRRATRERWAEMRGHDLIAADTDTFWVFDQVTAEFCAYAEPGAMPACRRPPADFTRKLVHYRDARVSAIEDATHLHVKAAPLAKDLVRVRDRFALLLPLPDMPVVFFDPRDGTLTPLVFRGGTLPAWVRSARSVAWDGHGLLLVGDDGIGRLTLAHFPDSH